MYLRQHLAAITPLNHVHADSDSDATQCSTVVQSTITFKCIGCQHNASSQIALATVSELLEKRESVPVNIFSVLMIQRQLHSNVCSKMSGSGLVMSLKKLAMLYT